MNKHIFEQQLIYDTAHDNDKAWARFTKVCIELDFRIRVSSSRCEIDGNKEDFETILELIKGE